jgi:hypothetical protein
MEHPEITDRFYFRMLHFLLTNQLLFHHQLPADPFEFGNNGEHV